MPCTLGVGSHYFSIPPQCLRCSFVHHHGDGVLLNSCCSPDMLIYDLMWSWFDPQTHNLIYKSMCHLKRMKSIWSISIWGLTVSSWQPISPQLGMIQQIQFLEVQMASFAQYWTLYRSCVLCRVNIYTPCGINSLLALYSLFWFLWQKTIAPPKCQQIQNDKKSMTNTFCLHLGEQ